MCNRCVCGCFKALILGWDWQGSWFSVFLRRLWVPDVLVGRQKNLKPCGFCRVQKIAVLKLVPSFLRGGADAVAGKKGTGVA
jgi:hypothetical protein